MLRGPPSATRHSPRARAPSATRCRDGPLSRRRRCLDTIAKRIRPDQLASAWTPWWKAPAGPEQIPDTAHAVLLRLFALDRHVKLKTS
jgi:hypothetical protein